MHVVDALVAETGRYLLAFLLNVQHQRQEAFDVRCGYIVAIRALDEGFALEIENRDEAGHGAAVVVVVGEEAPSLQSPANCAQAMLICHVQPRLLIYPLNIGAGLGYMELGTAA